MRDLTQDREVYQNKKRELEIRKKKLTSKIDKEIEFLDNKCGHNILFLLHYETKDKIKYFIRGYCYGCGRIISIRKLEDENYTNLIDTLPIISKFIPKYVKDSYKICVINEAVDSIVRNLKIDNYEDLRRVCVNINNILLNEINDINSFSNLQSRFKELVQSKKKSLKK